MGKTTLYILTGPTASGKEAAGLRLAREMGGEIIVVDSMKIYRGLDIGTAKPTAAMRAEVPHHCIDFVAQDVNFSVAEYVRGAERAVAQIVAAGKPVVLVGGTALYYKGLLEGLCDAPAADMAVRARLESEAAEAGLPALYARLQKKDPAAAAKIHVNDARRIVRALEVLELTGQTLSARQVQWAGFHAENPPARAAWRTDFDIRMAVLDWDRPRLRERIRARVDRMLDAGLLAEAEDVWKRRDRIARAPLQAVAYKEFFPYFAGECNLPTAVELLKTRTCQLAKSQMTWFRKFPAARVIPEPGMDAGDIARAVARAWETAPAQ